MSAGGNSSTAVRRGLLYTMALCILLLLGLRVHLMLRYNINWDEFHYLSFVHDFLRPAPLAWRQTFHVHFFSWLAALPRDEVAQIITARLTLVGLGLGTSCLLYYVGRRFLSPVGALFAVLCYSSLSYVIIHGASFRPDPLATFLLVAAAATLLARPASTVAAGAAGLLLALSFMFTLKTVFFVPGLAILVLTPAAGAVAWRRRLVRLAVLAAAGLLFVALLWAFHRQALVPPTSDAGQVAVVQRMTGGLLWTGHWFPGRFYLLRSLSQNVLVWALLAGGLGVAAASLRLPAVRYKVALPLLALALPLGTLVFYRNSFPYFFPYILALAVLPCGLALDRLHRRARRSGRLGPVLTVAIVLGVAVTGVTNYLRQLPHGLEGQRLLVSTVHRMFPEPVPYIDRCSMIASFPKAGFFMSTWGMDRYAARRQAVLTEAVKTQAPPFLVANSPPLNLLLPDYEATRMRYPLLAEDRQTLRQNYIHHWWLLFVAGKRLEIVSGETELSILIPGQYTLEGEMEVTIDGRLVRPDEVIRLDSGTHIVSTDTAGLLTLRWGDHLYVPDRRPPRQAIFIGL